jgi:hypothetical protein
MVSEQGIGKFEEENSSGLIATWKHDIIDVYQSR